MPAEVRVSVEWVGERADRRPTGPSFSSPARFLHQDEQSWRDDAWSVVLQCDVPPSEQPNPGVALARFLVPEAPHGWLNEHGFSMMDGKREIARVTVIR